MFRLKKIELFSSNVSEEEKKWKLISLNEMLSSRPPDVTKIGGGSIAYRVNNFVEVFKFVKLNKTFI